jgi:hypothetical protein
MISALADIGKLEQNPFQPLSGEIVASDEKVALFQELKNWYC